MSHRTSLQFSLVVVVFFLSVQSHAGTDIVGRFGVHGVQIVQNASAIEVFMLRGFGNRAPAAIDENGNRKILRLNKYELATEGRFLNLDQIELVKKYILDSSAYWEPRKNDTLLAAYLPSHALRITSEYGVAIVVVDDSGKRLKIMNEKNELFGSGLINRSQKIKWEHFLVEAVEGP